MEKPFRQMKVDQEIMMYESGRSAEESRLSTSAPGGRRARDARQDQGGEEGARGGRGVKKAAEEEPGAKERLEYAARRAVNAFCREEEAAEPRNAVAGGKEGARACTPIKRDRGPIRRAEEGPPKEELGKEAGGGRRPWRLRPSAMEASYKKVVGKLRLELASGRPTRRRARPTPRRPGDRRALRRDPADRDQPRRRGREGPRRGEVCLRADHGDAERRLPGERANMQAIAEELGDVEKAAEAKAASASLAEKRQEALKEAEKCRQGGQGEQHDPDRAARGQARGRRRRPRRPGRRPGHRGEGQQSGRPRRREGRPEKESAARPPGKRRAS